MWDNDVLHNVWLLGGIVLPAPKIRIHVPSPITGALDPPPGYTSIDGGRCN